MADPEDPYLGIFGGGSNGCPFTNEELCNYVRDVLKKWPTDSAVYNDLADAFSIPSDESLDYSASAKTSMYGISAMARNVIRDGLVATLLFDSVLLDFA